jgi:dephospho-CoA kinase
MLRLGLTGGIGSGKSTVATMWVELGATLVDTDRISRALTASGGAAMSAIAEAFGDAVVASDGSLDRDRMRALAFGDAQAKSRLEAILHPMIGAQAWREAAAACDGVVVFDVPLLAESLTWREKVSRILVVDCTESTQIDRVSRRPGWTSEAAARVVAQQAPRARRRAVADAVVHNDGIDLAVLRRHIRTLWTRWVDGEARTRD